MPPFNELNAVEHFIIHRLTGANLNQKGIVQEPPPPYGAQWQYLPAAHLDRDIHEVLVENELRTALIRINPEIARQPERAEEVIYRLRAILIGVQHIIQHFYEKVDPHGLKAMIVTPDRYACVQYKETLDKYIEGEASSVVISTTANDPLDFKQKYALDKDQQEKLIEKYEDEKLPLKFLIVTAKLLTGFDAPILQTMYLEKSLKDHTLLQAVCHTNRKYANKNFGRIVYYFGVFDDACIY